jgi:ubiquinol-cytochrome c reductase cytochrome c1 subunit
MMNMGFTKKIFLGLAVVFGLSLPAVASEAGPAWDKAPNNIHDMGSLQNGAKLFANYCLSCHSAAFNRYTRLQDLGFTQEEIKSKLLLTDAKIGDTMIAAIDPKQAKVWFGVNPPDLTVIARSRAGQNGTGSDYLYSYMRGFFRDETSPTGWNNKFFTNVGMPHVLWELQGDRVAVVDPKTHEITGFKQVVPGSLTEAQYDKEVGDLVNYLQWMGEPAQTSRQRLGVWVLAFLAVFTFITWRLNKAFWKDIK